jgi:predicted Zn finger-like uncharacterized protein
MIIECQTCHARFRLDDSRIKGRGARVKCRKCGDSIVVLKDGAPPPPTAPGGEGFFDLGSAVRDSVGERPGSLPPAGNLIPFPAPARPVEPFSAESPSAGVEAAGPAKDDVDLAFDRVLFPATEGSIPSIREAEAGVPESDAPVDPEPRPEMDLGALNLDLVPEEKLDLPPPVELDLPPPVELEPPLGEPPAVEPPAEFRGEGGFLISDSDTLDFLQEKHRDTGSEAPPGAGDISLEISFAPVDEGDSFLREPDASAAPREDRTTPASRGISLDENVTPPPMPVIEVPPYRETESVPAPPVESAVRRGSPVPDSPRPRSSAGPAAAVLLAILLAAGGYLGFTTSGRKTLERAIPGVAALWGENPSAPASSKYDLRNVIGYYESGGASPRILVIKGQVANLSKSEKGGIRVQATLLDNTDAVLAQLAVYAGNMLSGEAIRKGDRETVSKALGNRFGEGLANMSVAPGKAIPFMVVFFDAPTTMDSYKLEAMDGE